MGDREPTGMAGLLAAHRGPARAKWDRLTTDDYATIGTEGDLADAVERRYGLSPQAARRDVSAWLDAIGLSRAPADTGERTSRAEVRFPHAFAVASLGRELPAGVYEVTTVEERIEGLSFLAYRTVSTSLVAAVPGGTGAFELAHIDPSLVREALLEGGMAGDVDARPAGSEA